MNEPLFILAPPRSFTSVICAMLGNHPQMFGLAETNLFAAGTMKEMQRIHRARPRLAHGLLRSVAELGLGSQTVADIEAAQQWVDEQGDRGTADVFHDLMEWAGERAVIEKSPLHVYAAGGLDRMPTSFPTARFLHLTRDPRATCESIYKTRHLAQGAGGGALAQNDAAITPDKMWYKPHLRIMASIEHVPAAQKMQIRGEVLMADPRRHLPEIAEWLGISTAEADIEAMMSPEKSPFACMGPENARCGNDPLFLSSPALRPYKEKPSDLDAPLSWDSKLIFNEDLKDFARTLGY